jgi:hypothetical protein
MVSIASIQGDRVCMLAAGQRVAHELIGAVCLLRSLVMRDRRNGGDHAPVSSDASQLFYRNGS